MKIYLFYMLALLVLCCDLVMPSKVCVAQTVPASTNKMIQDEGDTTYSVEEIVKEIRKEIGNVCQIELAMTIESYRKVLELDEEDCSKLKTSGSKAIEVYVNRFTDEQISNLWEQLLFSDDKITGIIINGRKCLVKELKENEQGTVPVVSVSMFSSTIFIACEVDSATISNKLVGENQFQLERFDDWQNANVLTEDQRVQYREHELKTKRERVTSLILDSLTISLKLSDDQLETTKKWIDASIEDALKETEIYHAAKKGLALLSDPPANFSPEQQEILLMLKAGAR